MNTPVTNREESQGDYPYTFHILGVAETRYDLIIWYCLNYLLILTFPSIPVKCSLLPINLLSYLNSAMPYFDLPMPQKL